MGKVVETCCLIIDAVTDVDFSYGLSLPDEGNKPFLLNGTIAYLNVIESAFLTALSFY